METTIQTKERTFQIFKNRDERGVILTYCLLDYNDSSLRDYTYKEFNTLKELNKFINGLKGDEEDE